MARFVEREIRAYIACGVLTHGFLRVHCDACDHDRLVAFSCKGRGFCPSCGGRRIADTATHLVDCVLPEVSIRQWVLTLPYPLRYGCAWNAKLTFDQSPFEEKTQTTHPELLGHGDEEVSSAERLPLGLSRFGRTQFGGKA